MAQNFLYMFEFVVDDLLITRPNYCAPDEYPTCAEISFRSSVFVSIADREFGDCVDPCAPKCGKCCLFALEAPVTEKDRLLIHIYKKKTERCKFLIGATEIPIKPLFDKVTESFNVENPNWMEQLAKHSASLQNPQATVVDNECDEEGTARREQMCPTAEITKRLLPLFNLKNLQAGNLILLMRLVCNGPTIVSSFPFSRICSTSCQKPPCCSYKPTCPNKQTAPRSGVCSQPDPCGKDHIPKKYCRRYFACNADMGFPPGCGECEDDCDRVCPKVCKRKKKRRQPSYLPTPSSSCCPTDNYTAPEPMQRYFSSEPKDSCCQSDDGMDECDAAKAKALRKLRYLMAKYAGMKLR